MRSPPGFEYKGPAGASTHTWAGPSGLTVKVAPKNGGAFTLGGRRYVAIAALDGRRETIAERTGEEEAARAALAWMEELR